jgi:hypothetical protein
MNDKSIQSVINVRRANRMVKQQMKRLSTKTKNRIKPLQRKNIQEMKIRSRSKRNAKGQIQDL